MLSPFWLIWLIFLFMFLVAPLGYGWGYRGWGMAYPRYVQRRRALRRGDVPSQRDHLAWGRGGDLVWLGLLIAFIWAILAFMGLH